MEKSDEFYDSCLYNIPKISTKKCLKVRKRTREICDISNANLSKKSKKLSIIQKYRSAYLKKYIYSKGVNYYRRSKKTFVIPVFPVTRRPDNTFDVKNIVDNLKKNQDAADPLKSAQNQPLLIDKETSCLTVGKRETKTKTKNWETIRYKYQLDYKEKLKMEREKIWKEYAGKRKVANKQQRTENIRSFYQGVEEPTAQYNTEMPRYAGTTKGQLVDRNLHYKTTARRQTDQSENGYKKNSERQPQTSAVSASLNTCEESIKYYHRENGTNNARESVDLTKEYENNILIPRSDVQQMRLVRNEGSTLKRANIHTELERNEILHSSDALSVNFEHSNEIPKKQRREDYDFSIPFNESNILIKVMTPDGNYPLNLTSQSNSLLQDTLQYATEAKRKSNTAKRASYDQEPKSDSTRLDHGSENQWIKYIQNILSRTCDPKAEFVEKKTANNHSRSLTNPVDTAQYVNKTNEPVSNEYVDHRPVPNIISGQQPSVIKVKTSTAPIPATTNYYDPLSIGRMKQDRPLIPNPRVLRPKVLHPNPYMRSDLLRNNSQYNDQLDDQVGVTLTVPQYPSAPQISDQSTMPQHMEYVYSQTANYHPEYNMMRNRRIPLDITHPNLMRQTVFSPYDSPFMPYRNDIERISQPLLDPYIQHNMHVPHVAPNVGFLPHRPTAPVYRYLHPQHVHPVWGYPHMPER